MNYGFKSIVIEPFNGYLDFQGPLNPENASGSITLKGDIHLDLTKAVKVKSATIKFKGYSRVCHQNTIDSVDISTPILPKLKTQLFTSTTTLGPGQVTLPWEMEILNVYPASVMIKRASINYKIELSISLGLKRVVTSTYPIVIRRHLLPSKQVATMVPVKMYSKTISTKFHYEITAPRIVCIAQTFIPFHVKLLSIGSQKRVLSVRTQILQIELYRCNALPKSEANMTRFKTQLMKPKKPLPSGKKELNKYAKYTKRTIPAIIHTLDETEPMSSNQPILLRHPLDEYLSLGLESPLASIYHQLEITFQFGAKFEDIRAKIPILISSTTKNDTQANNNSQPPPMPSYPFERLNLPEPLFVMDETRLEQNGNAPTIRALAPSAKGNIDTSGGSSPTTATDDKNDIDNASIEHNQSSDDSSGSPRLHKKQSKVNIDSALCMNNNSSNSSNNTSPTAVHTANRSNANLCISFGSHDVDDDDNKENKNNIMDNDSFNTHHKYNSITTNTFTDNKYSNSSNDNTLVNNSLPIPPVKHRRPSNTSILSTNDNTGKSSTSLTIQPQRYLSTDNVESSNGMWPRPPDSSVPSQWRRRSASQSHINDNNQITQKQKLLNNTRIQTKSQSNLFSAANNQNQLHHNYNNNVNNNKLITQNVRQTLSPTPTPPIMPKNKYRPQYQQNLQPQFQQQQFDCSSSVYESTNFDEDDEDEEEEYDDESYTDGSDKSSHRAPSLVSGASQTESSSYDLQSRPTSPIYPNAPGLPPAISLRPQDANPVALLEESFVPSPGSLASTPVVSSHNLASSSRNYRRSGNHHGGWYDSTTFGSQPMDMMSVVSNAQSSVIDADMMVFFQRMAVERQQEINQERNLEQHYTNAELPPIPRRSSNDKNQSSTNNNNNSNNNNNKRPTTIYYVDDSDGEEIDNSGMYDSDDQSLANLSCHENINHSLNNNEDDDQVQRDLYIPPIAGSPLPPLPRQIHLPREESVCICPRHGVAVQK